MYRKLFTPCRIGSIEVPNRLVVPAMVSNMCTADGCVTERYIAYHEAKAKGGWGLIITEDYAVDEKGKGYRFIAGLWNDAQIAGQKQFTDRIHRYESKVVAQIYHAGRQTKRAVIGEQPIAPSAIPCPWCRDLPREMTIAEIRKTVAQFGDAARRAKQAGFDGVEVHGAHGYLISEFMSPYSNKRTDEYGGCLTNRLRFAREVIDDVRGKVGSDFTVLFRISADEVRPGGLDIAETRVIVRLLEEWGVDAIHVSSGVYGNAGTVSPMVYPHAWIVDLAAEVKKLVSIPVITVNRINDPMMADVLLDMGKADFVAMGRGSIADPELPNKARSGDLQSIRYCIGCLQACTGHLSAAQGGDGPIGCAVNPLIGYEYNTNLDPAARKQKVLIAGGGPAGMEAAYAAAIKGHEVHLYEKSGQLGGLLRCAAYPPFKGELAGFTAWQIAELKKYPNLTIHMNTPLTAERARAESPDLIIVATGASPIVPDIPGIHRPNVLAAEDVLLGNVPTGNNCFVAGGGSVGVETAAHLALQLKRVTIADVLPELAPTEKPIIKGPFLRLLRENGVTEITSAKIVEIGETGVLLEKNGQTTMHPCDTVILAFGYRKNDALAAELDGIAARMVVIGDALGAAQLAQATRTGFVAGIEA